MRGDCRSSAAGVPRLLSDVTAQLRSAGCVFAEEEAALLLGAAADDAELSALVARRVTGEPLEHLLGFVEFKGARYRLGPGVFIPRQRSALLVEEAVRRGGTRILDLCCGCGALGLAAHARLGGELVAVDISPAAIEYARANGVENALLGDLFAPLSDGYRHAFDLIIANAPYVPRASLAEMPRESRQFEPVATVDGGIDGMDVQRRVLTTAAEWLAPGGVLLTETSRAQENALAHEARRRGWTVSLVSDTDRGASILVAQR